MTVSTTAGWRPNPGDSVTGKVVDLSEHDGGYGSYVIVEIEQADGTAVALHAFHEVFASELAKASPKVGDELTVSYLGRADTERAPHIYRVRRPGAVSSIDWSKYGGAGVEELVEQDEELRAAERQADEQKDNGDEPIPF